MSKGRRKPVEMPDMTIANRQAVLFLAMTACVLTAASAPIETVLCLASNGHFAVEREHGCCNSRTDNDTTYVRITDVAMHRCCVDIPLPGGRPCTVETHKHIGDCSQAETPLVHSAELFAAPQIAPANANSPPTADPPTATIILLI